MAKIIFTNGARDDLHQLHEYLSRISPAYAKRLLDKIISRVDVLRSFPQSGRKLPEAPSDESYGNCWKVATASFMNCCPMTGF